LGFIRSSGSGGGDRFDLPTITVVPEPTGIALLGLGGVAALRRRRRMV
jgi:hypothetical protein